MELQLVAQKVLPLLGHPLPVRAFLVRVGRVVRPVELFVHPPERLLVQVQLPVHLRGQHEVEAELPVEEPRPPPVAEGKSR